MSADVAQLEAKLRELASERDALLNARTKEGTAEAARTFLEAARTRSVGVGGLVVGGHAAGQPLDDVLRAFLLADPTIESFLVERAAEFAEMTAKQRDGRLRKITGEIKEAEVALRDAAKAEAIREVEERFGGVAA